MSNTHVYLPLVALVESDIPNAFAVDDGFEGDPFELVDILTTKKIRLQKYSSLAEDYYFTQEIAYQLKGMEGWYLQQPKLPF